MKNRFTRRHLAVAALSVAVGSAHAVGPDYSALTGAIDFSTASAAVLAGFVLLAGFGLVVKGGSVILRKLGLRV